eukprot:GGOE01061927.1.p1 GENE.GGOE01061927.1~~GGOE01061927.1.p1  ORF type:complete len:493 (-),score=77.07 GGOE01061927.1:101-1579(-)
MSAAVLKVPSCLGYRYKLHHKIGSGTFGFVFDAVDLNSGEIVAIKISAANKTSAALLQHEARISALFGGKLGEPEKGFPKFHTCTQSSDLTYMVMERLGPNLDLLLKYHGKGFSLKTVILLGHQMLNRIERFHNKGFLHRDIKPHNFTMGWGKSGFCLYLIDFGLTARYVNSRSEHIIFSMGKGLIGTPWFCSINAHDGCELSRRDDLESLFYVLVYLLRGHLPWQRVQNKEKDQWNTNIRQLKVESTAILEELPPEFTSFYHHVRGLDFKQKPQYNTLRRLLCQLFERHGFVNDYRFDWVAKKEHWRSEPAEADTHWEKKPMEPPEHLVMKSKASPVLAPATIGAGSSNPTASFMIVSCTSNLSNAANVRSSILHRPMSLSTRSVQSFASNSSFSVSSMDSEEDDVHKKRMGSQRALWAKRHPRAAGAHRNTTTSDSDGVSDFPIPASPESDVGKDGPGASPALRKSTRKTPVHGKEIVKSKPDDLLFDAI